MFYHWCFPAGKSGFVIAWPGWNPGKFVLYNCHKQARKPDTGLGPAVPGAGFPATSWFPFSEAAATVRELVVGWWMCHRGSDL